MSNLERACSHVLRKHTNRSIFFPSIMCSRQFPIISRVESNLLVLNNGVLYSTKNDAKASKFYFLCKVFLFLCHESNNLSRLSSTNNRYIQIENKMRKHRTNSRCPWEHALVTCRTNHFQARGDQYRNDDNFNIFAMLINLQLFNVIGFPSR